jgi:Ser/Thr protein kinase RdoA (MazF antagonist)
LEVAAYDFDDIKIGWFVQDLAHVINTLHRNLPDIQTKQKAVNWLCDGYS